MLHPILNFRQDDLSGLDLESPGTGTRFFDKIPYARNKDCFLARSGPIRRWAFRMNPFEGPLFLLSTPPHPVGSLLATLAASPHLDDNELAGLG